MGTYRDRMERDLQIRGFSPCTQACYLGRMKAFVRYFMRPPDQLSLEDIHTYQLHLTRERKVSWGVFNQAVAALRFFYGVTLEQDWDIRRIPYQKTGRKLPVVLSQGEVQALLQTPKNLKHRALLMTVYAAGLRVSEVVVSDHRKTYFFGLSPTGHRSRQPRLWRGIGGNGSVQRLNRPQIEHRQRVGERRGAGELIVPPP